MYTRDIIGQPSNRSFQTYKRKPLKKDEKENKNKIQEIFLKKKLLQHYSQVCVH